MLKAEFLTTEDTKYTEKDKKAGERLGKVEKCVDKKAWGDWGQGKRVCGCGGVWGCSRVQKGSNAPDGAGSKEKS
jgi:hypothetical protein